MFFNAKVFVLQTHIRQNLCKRLSFSRCSKYWPDTRARLPGDAVAVAVLPLKISAVAALVNALVRESRLCGLEGVLLNIGIDGGTSKLLCWSLCSILAQRRYCGILHASPCSAFPAALSLFRLSLRSRLALSFSALVY